jgi:hypothetical protein
MAPKARTHYFRKAFNAPSTSYVIVHSNPDAQRRICIVRSTALNWANKSQEAYLRQRRDNFVKSGSFAAENEAWFRAMASWQAGTSKEVIPNKVPFSHEHAPGVAFRGDFDIVLPCWWCFRRYEFEDGHTLDRVNRIEHPPARDNHRSEADYQIALARWGRRAISCAEASIKTITDFLSGDSWSSIRKLNTRNSNARHKE